MKYWSQPTLQVDRVLRRTLPLAGAYRTLLKWRAWQAARFGEPEIRLPRYLVDPMRTALDIGAAEGVYAFFLQRLAQRCIAFEPNPSSHWGFKACYSRDRDPPGCGVIRGRRCHLTIPYAGWGTIEPKNQLAELPTHVVDEFKVRTMRLYRMALGDVGL